MKRLSELTQWPVFDEPYLVDGVPGPYVETIVSGATDGANLIPDGVPGMIVDKDEWKGEHFDERFVLKIRLYTPR